MRSLFRNSSRIVFGIPTVSPNSQETTEETFHLLQIQNDGRLTHIPLALDKSAGGLECNSDFLPTVGTSHEGVTKNHTMPATAASANADSMLSHAMYAALLETISTRLHAL